MAATPAILPRTLAAAIRVALADTPVVCLVGPRQSGKTTLAQILDARRRFITLDDLDYRRTAQDDPHGFLAELPDFVAIDEIQKAPDLLSAIKISVDRDRRPGRFLLTGSANLLQIPTVTESLAGRMEIQLLHPLTEAEKERRPGGFLRAFLNGDLRNPRPADRPDAGVKLPERLVLGGYPEVLGRSPERARQWHRNYLGQIIERDVRDVARVRQPIEVLRLLEALAIRPAATLNVSRLANGLDFRRETVLHYLSVLERLFLIRRLPAWHSSESKRLVKSPKVHLLDSGLTATLAGRTTEDWLENRAAMGGLLETFVVQQLIAQAAWTDPDLRFWHYRDRDQAEVDLVITLRRRVWGIEIKAGSAVEPRDAHGLRRLAAVCGNQFEAGIVLYTGEGVWRLGDPRLHSVGVRELWER